MARPSTGPCPRLAGRSGKDDAVALDDHCGQLDSFLDGVFEGEAACHALEEATDAGVAGSVRVNDLFPINFRDGHLDDGGVAARVGCGDDDGLGSLSDHGDARALLVSFLVVADKLGSLKAVACLEALLLSHHTAFVLIAEDKIGVFDRVHDVVIVGVDDPGRRDIEQEGLVILRAVAANLTHRLGVGGDEEGRGVDMPGGLEEPDVLVQVRGRVFDAGTEVGTKTALLAYDDSSTCSCRCILVFVEVRDDTGFND